MNIPYTVEARPDSGLTNGKFGIWLFLASEVMLFGALFSTYIILRVGAAEWPHGEANICRGNVGPGRGHEPAGGSLIATAGLEQATSSEDGTHSRATPQQVSPAQRRRR